MDGEHTVIQTEQYTFDMEGHPEQPYYNDKEALSKEAFQKKLDSMGKTVSGLKWKTLSERITGEADPEAARRRSRNGECRTESGRDKDIRKSDTTGRRTDTSVF